MKTILLLVALLSISAFADFCAQKDLKYSAISGSSMSCYDKDSSGALDYSEATLLCNDYLPLMKESHGRQLTFLKSDKKIHSLCLYVLDNNDLPNLDELKEFHKSSRKKKSRNFLVTPSVLNAYERQLTEDAIIPEGEIRISLYNCSPGSLLEDYLTGEKILYCFDKDQNGVLDKAELERSFLSTGQIVKNALLGMFGTSGFAKKVGKLNARLASKSVYLFIAYYGNVPNTLELQKFMFVTSKKMLYATETHLRKLANILNEIKLM